MDIKTCTVCGKQYDKCKTPYIAKGYFRWQDVACSPQCAIEYLNRKEQALEETQNTSESEDVIVEEPKKTTKKARKASATDDKVESQP